MRNKLIINFSINLHFPRFSMRNLQIFVWESMENTIIETGKELQC